MFSDTMSYEIPRISRSQLREPQDISHSEADELMNGASVGDVLEEGTSHAITPEGGVLALADDEPPRWIGNLV
ncbi:MAG: hypothetical protein OXR82_00445 [Gammaproteobacteria bacterium]|nr:hypothetical protein [Gammaproteobacteria bacterium]